MTETSTKITKGKRVKATPLPDLNTHFTPILLGKVITSQRTHLGLRIVDLAEKIKLSKDTVNKIEKGDSNVKFSNILKVLEFLGINILLQTDNSIESNKVDNDEWY